MSKSTVAIIYDQIQDLNTSIKKVKDTNTLLSMQMMDHQQLEVLFRKEIDEIDELVQQQEQSLFLLFTKMKAISSILTNYDSCRNHTAQI